MGQFVKALLRIPNFSADRVVATEYSSYSLEVLNGLGVDAQRCSVFGLAAYAENRAFFDAACAFQSVEHMANAMEVTLTLKEMVKPGGLVILSVHRGPAIEFNEHQLSCFDLPPNHVGCSYRESFEVLAEKAGKPRGEAQMIQNKPAACTVRGHRTANDNSSLTGGIESELRVFAACGPHNTAKPRKSGVDIHEER